VPSGRAAAPLTHSVWLEVNNLCLSVPQRHALSPTNCRKPGWGLRLAFIACGAVLEGQDLGCEPNATVKQWMPCTSYSWFKRVESLGRFALFKAIGLASSLVGLR